MMRLWRLRAWCEFASSLDGVPFFLSCHPSRRGDSLRDRRKLDFAARGSVVHSRQQTSRSPDRIRANVALASARRPEE